MKTLLAALLAAFSPLATFAAENKYDALAHVLMPFVSVFAEKSEGANRAVRLSAQIEEATGLPPELLNAGVDLAIEYPDKLRLRAPVLGEELTIIRRGQELWVHPGARAKALVESAAAAHTLPALDRKFRLAPFRLPIPEKQLVFLPALFSVRDAGEVPLGGESCRVLDLTLLPMLANSLGADGWSARLWIHRDGTPARLMLTGPEAGATIRFESIRFSPTLPPATWQPTPEQADDVWKIPPARYDQLLRAVTGAR